jgi:hypothetical protein
MHLNEGSAKDRTSLYQAALKFLGNVLVERLIVFLAIPEGARGFKGGGLRRPVKIFHGPVLVASYQWSIESSINRT